MEANIDAAEMDFIEGREVEATRDEEGYKGAWYTVTILKLQNQNNTDGKALVQYKNLLEDDNKTPFTENVPLSNIRPLPPQPKVPCKQCFEVKDVVDAFHLDGWWPGSVYKVLGNPKRYIVSFADGNEDVEFSSSELRPHWERVDGKWVTSSILQDVLVSSDCQEPMGQSCNTSTKDVGTTVQLERSDALKCGSKKLEPCCSSRKSEMYKHVKRATTEGDATPLHPSKKSKDGSLANSSVPESNMKNEWELKRERRKISNREYARKSLLKKQAVTEELACKVESLTAENATLRSKINQLTETSEKEINLQKEHDVSRYKEEDGAKTGINRTEQPNVVLEIQQPKSVPQISQSTYAKKDDVGGVLEEMCSEEQTSTEVESSKISRLEQAERTSVLSATDSQRKIIKMAGDSGRILHEIHSVIMHENNPGHIPHGFADQVNDPAEKSLETAVQSPLVVIADDNEPQKGQDLPFVKSLPMWKDVESMEIFQIMPQNPHFRPLDKFNEILREGIAVGHMLSFASMVHMTSKLGVADPRSDFTSILDALPDFEILGFDVKAVRDRTSDLLLMKDRHKYLEGHSKEVNLQVKQYSNELTKINEAVDANYKEMRELEEKQALLLFMKESKTFELDSLQVSSDVTTQHIHKVENDFESLAGSPW